MGQHKHNPTAIAAKNGELPPREKPLSKRDRERMFLAALQEKWHEPLTNVYEELQKMGQGIKYTQEESF